MRADAWRSALDALPPAGLDGIAGSAGGLMVVAPHPDDESLGCGGLLAAAAEAGRDLALAILTDGTGSHPGSHRYPPARLGALRREEALEAARALGLAATQVSFLQLPDTAVPRAGAAAERAAARLTAMAAGIDAAAIVVTSPLDPHGDHQAAFVLAEEAVRRLGAAHALGGVARRPALWSYPIWALHLADDAEVATGTPFGVRLDIGAWREAKRRAIAAHRSQTTDLIDDSPYGFRLGPAMLERFAGGFETFLAHVPSP